MPLDPLALDTAAYETEQDIVQGRVPPDQLDAATAAWRRYDERVKTEGRARYSALFKSKQDEAERIRGFYLKPDNGLSDDQRATIEALTQHADNPQDARSQVFNANYFANLHGQSLDDVSAQLPIYNRDYAQKEMSKADATDSQVFEHIKSRMELGDALAHAARASALTDEPGVKAFGTFTQANALKPGFNADKVGAMQQQFDALRSEKAAEIAPYQGIIASTVDALGKIYGTGKTKVRTDESPLSLAENLLDIPKQARPTVLQAVADLAALHGADVKGFAQQLGESLARGAESLISAQGISLDRQGLLSAQMDLQAAKAGKPDAAGIYSFEFDGRGYSMDAAELDRNIAGVSRGLDLLDLESDVKRIGEQTVDPVNGENFLSRGAYAVAGIVPLMGAAVVPGVGWMATYNALTVDNFDKFRLENPNMDREKGWNMAQISAVPQTMLMNINGRFLTGQMPTLGRFLNSVVTTPGQIAGRAGIRFGEEAGVQYLSMNAQEAIPAFVHDMGDAIDKDTGLHLTHTLDQLGKQFTPQHQLELATQIAMLSIIGSGVGTWHDVANSRGLLQNESLIRPFVETDAQAAEVRKLSLAGDMDGAGALFNKLASPKLRDGMTLEKSATQAIEQQRQHQIAQAAAREQMLSYEVNAPAIGLKPDGTGWRLSFDKGDTFVDYPTHEKADEARWAHTYEMQGQRPVLLLRQIFARSEKAQMRPGEMWQRAWDLVPLDTQDTARMIKEGVQNMEAELKRREEQAKTLIEGSTVEDEHAKALTMLDAISPTAEDARAGHWILGFNQAKFSDGLRRITTKMFGDNEASPLTALEEDAEIHAKLIYDRQEGGKEWMLKSLREYESVTGDKVFRTKDDAALKRSDYIEAFSHMALSTFAGEAAAEGSTMPEAAAFREFHRKTQELSGLHVAPSILAMAQKWQAAFKRGAAIREAIKAGTIKGDLAAAIAKAAGLSEQHAHEADVMKEAVKVAGEAGGKTFSTAPKVTPEQDADYSRAVESGDTATAQKMVDEADAEKYRQAERQRESIIRKLPAIASEDTPEGYAERVEAIQELLQTFTVPNDFELKGAGATKWGSIYIQARDVFERNEHGEATDFEDFKLSIRDHEPSPFREKEFGKVNKYVEVSDPYSPQEISQAITKLEQWLDQKGYKSDAVTRDAQGNVIPLSKRFDSSRNETTFSTAPISDQLAGMFQAFERSPDLRKTIGLELQRRAIAEGRKWEAESNAFLSPKQEAMERAVEDRQNGELAAMREQRNMEVADARTQNADAQTITQLQATWREKIGRLQDRHAQELADMEKGQESSAAKASMLASLRTLDAIAAVVAPQIGHVNITKVATLKTDAARLKAIKDRVELIDRKLEKALQKDLRGQIETLFEKSKPDMEAGKKVKGKLGAEAHEILTDAQSVSQMDAMATAGEIAKLDSALASGDLTPEQEVTALAKRELYQLVGDMKHADAARLDAALSALTMTRGQGMMEWMLKTIAKREARAQVREALVTDTGKTGAAPERDEQAAYSKKFLGSMRDKALSLSSFNEVMRYAFGRDSASAKDIIDREREASNQKEDEMQSLSDSVSELFTSLAGSTIKGERMLYDLAQPTIKTAKKTLSPLEAIQALLMWRQEDGQRHMIGSLDENGKPDGKWSYDQAWIDEISSQLSPRALAVMRFIQDNYAGEWDELNPLYQERHGVNLPHNKNYAPLTVTPSIAKAGEMVDPVSGAVIHGNNLTPGSLRTRNVSAIAEPRFPDALRTLIAHKAQMAHWKAYYDLAVDAQAIVGNRDVGNAVEAAAGEKGKAALRQWSDYFAQGGVRDAGALLAANQALNRATGRAATMALFGRVSTLLVQSVQLGAAAVQMPLPSYMMRLGKLLTGQLSWGDAIRSDFIQRRIRQMPPIVRQAMQELASATKPNAIKHATSQLGKLLSGADGLFTAGTYAIILDHQRANAEALGMHGADAEAWAHTEAERLTEEVAQPTRAANRSLAEITNTNPLGRLMWAFASESRQKLMLTAWALRNVKGNKARAAKTAFLTFIVGGLATQVLKNLWKDAKGDDDEEKWSAKRLTIATLAGPLSGIPGFDAMMGQDNLFGRASRAGPSLKDLATFDEPDAAHAWKDAQSMLWAAGLFSDTAASVSALGNAGEDSAKLLGNLFSKE